MHKSQKHTHTDIEPEAFFALQPVKRRCSLYIVTNQTQIFEIRTQSHCFDRLETEESRKQISKEKQT